VIPVGTTCHENSPIPLSTTTADLYYEEIKNGLLTKSNIYTLQCIFYPDDGSIASEVELCVCVLFANQSNDEFDCWCPQECYSPSYGVTFTLHISTNSWNIKSYLEKFLNYIQFTDITFYNILSTLINYQDANNLWVLYTESELSTITIVLSNTTDFNSQDELSLYLPIMSLFKWVSVSYLKL